jgi:hypothetical protein
MQNIAHGNCCYFVRSIKNQTTTPLHRFFKYNFGHLFVWFDKIFSTYRDPKEFAPKSFNDGV